MLNQFKGQSKEQIRNIKCASGGKTVFSMVMGVRMEVRVRVEVGVIPLDRIRLHNCKQKLVSIAISYLQLIKL